MPDELSLVGELPPLEDRRAVYLAWRESLAERARRNRELLADDDQPSLSPEWSPERLFEESRRLAEAERLAS